MAGTDTSSSTSDYDSAGSDYEGAPSASYREEQQDPQTHASVTEAPLVDLDKGGEALMAATVSDEAQLCDDADLLQRADELKLEGNRLYGEGKFTEAAVKYNEAIANGERIKDLSMQPDCPPLLPWAIEPAVIPQFA